MTGRRDEDCESILEKNTLDQTFRAYNCRCHFCHHGLSFSFFFAGIDFVLSLFADADTVLCRTTHWLHTGANKHPFRSSSNPRERRVIFYVGAKLNIPLWRIHHLLPVRFKLFAESRLQPQRWNVFLTPPSCNFQRVGGLIWRCQEPSFRCKHIKERGWESVFS